MFFYLYRAQYYVYSHGKFSLLCKGTEVCLNFFGDRKLPEMSTAVSTTTVIAWPDSFEDSGEY